MNYSSTLSPPPEHYYDPSTYEAHRQQYAQISPVPSQQQQNEQEFSHLSLGKFESFCAIWFSK